MNSPLLGSLRVAGYPLRGDARDPAKPVPLRPLEIELWSNAHV